MDTGSLIETTLGTVLNYHRDPMSILKNSMDIGTQRAQSAPMRDASTLLRMFRVGVTLAENAGP